jgi:hypothetical protein
MTKKRKTALYMAGGLIDLIVMVLLLRTVFNRPFTSQIPLVEESQALSESINEQLADATKKARRVPSAENLGVLAEVTDLMLFDLEEREKAPKYLVLLNHFLPSNPKVQKMSAWTVIQKI